MTKEKVATARAALNVAIAGAFTAVKEAQIPIWAAFAETIAPALAAYKEALRELEKEAGR